MNKFVNKVVKVITIYGEELIGIVIQKSIFVLHLKTNIGILSIALEDISDIILIGDVTGVDQKWKN